MDICPFLKDNTCLISTQMANNMPVKVDEIACRFCTESCSPPRNPNCVTYCLAYKIKENITLEDWNTHCNKKLEKDNKNEELLKKILSGKGVGSQLWKLLEKIGIEHTANCGCVSWAERMNKWGPDICLKNKKEIVEHMKSSAKNYGWGNLTLVITKSIITGIAFKINLLDVYGSLLDEAIKLAKIEENRLPIPDGALKYD